MVEGTAKRVAFQLALPWHLDELKTAALCGAQKTKHDPRLGRSRTEQVQSSMDHAAEREGGRLRQARNDGTLDGPTAKQIADALRTFTPEQWQYLVPRFEKADLEVLLMKMRDSVEDLRLEWGQRRYANLYVAAMHHKVHLMLKTTKLIPVSDVFWAAVWRSFAHDLKKQGIVKPSVKRTADEMGSDRAIAEGLSQHERAVHGKTVAKYFQRMQQLPPEQFNGGWFDYYATIADTKRFKQYLRSYKQSGGLRLH